MSGLYGDVYRTSRHHATPLLHLSVSAPLSWLAGWLQVTSSAKKQRDPKSQHIHQTPEGAFYDLQRNAWQVRLPRCTVLSAITCVQLCYRLVGK